MALISLRYLALFFVLSRVEAFAPVASFNKVSPKQGTTSLNMFTGIVEEMGTVISLEERDDMVLWDGSKGRGTELTLKGEVVLDGAYLG